MRAESHEHPQISEMHTTAALGVCRESRRKALKKFTIRYKPIPRGPQVVYISPQLDMVSLNSKDPESIFRLSGDLEASNEIGDGMLALGLNLSLFL